MTIAIITGIITIVGLLLKAWLANAPARLEEVKNEKIQQNKIDSMSGDSISVPTRLDRVLDVQASDSISNARSTSCVLEGEGADTIQRLANLGIRNG